MEKYAARHADHLDEAITEFRIPSATRLGTQPAAPVTWIGHG
jgi:hypothetical protein